MYRLLLVGIFTIISLAGCSNKDAGSNQGSSFVVTGPDGQKWDVKAPKEATEADAIRFVAETEYGIKSPPVDGPPMRTFGQYDCTDDCSGHEAGYEWAERNGIEDPDDCGGKSWSFIEGCQAYAEEFNEE